MRPRTTGGIARASWRRGTVARAARGGWRVGRRRGSVVACGQIGGLVRDGEVPVALYPENECGMTGPAFLRDEGGPLAVRAYIFTSMELLENAFNPAELWIPANTDVVISLPNNGVAVQNFIIDELGVNSGDLPAGGLVCPSGIRVGRHRDAV